LLTKTINMRVIETSQYVAGPELLAIAQLLQVTILPSFLKAPTSIKKAISFEVALFFPARKTKVQLNDIPFITVIIGQAKHQLKEV